MKELRDNSRQFPPPSFRCEERIEEGEVGSVSFHWRVQETHALQVSCRGRSVGVLAVGETAVKDDELDDYYEQVDSNFFDPGYTLAGRTGFQVWAGSRLLMEALTTTASPESKLPQLNEWQRRLSTGCKVLELGSGTGVTGLSLAAIGAQVVLTDLPTLVDHATRPNVELNQSSSNTNTTEGTPEWMKSSDPVSIVQGWAGTASLDWTKPLSKDLMQMATEVELIVACDCVWLKSMLDALLDTVESVFVATAVSDPILLLSFQRRNSGAADTSSQEGSGMFTTVPGVVDAVKARGWSIQCLTWRTVAMDGQETDKEVFVLEIKPR